MASRSRAMAKYVFIDGHWLTISAAYEREMGADTAERQRPPAKVPWNRRERGPETLTLFAGWAYREAPTFSLEDAYRETIGGR